MFYVHFSCESVAGSHLVANGGKCSVHALILSWPAEMATLVVGRDFLCDLYLTRSTGKNLEACPVSTM